MSESREVLSLLLEARYVGHPAFSAMSGDIDRLVAKTSALEKVGAGFNMVGNAFIAAGVAATVGVATILKETEKYQQAINRIQSVGAIPQGQKALIDFSNQVHDATQRFGIDSTKFADGIYPIMSSLGAVQSQFGLATDSMSLMHDAFRSKLLPDLAAYIEASGAGLEGSVSMTDGLQQLHTILEATHVPLQQFGKVMGDLTAIEQHSATLQSQLATALPRALTTTAVANMPYQDVFAAVGAAAMSGILGSRAGTEFSSAMRTVLTSPTAAAQLTKMGLSVKDLYGADGQMSMEGTLGVLIPKLDKMAPAQRLAAETALFGAVGGRTINPMLNQEGFKQYEYLRNLENGDTRGEMYKTAAQMADLTPMGKLLQLFSALRNTAQDIGIALSQPFMTLIDHLQAAVQWVDTLARKFETLPDAEKNAIGQLILASPLLLLGGGVGMKGVGSGLSYLGKNNRLTDLANAKAAEELAARNAAGQAAVDAANLRSTNKYQRDLTTWQNAVAATAGRNSRAQASWQNAVALGNQRFSDAELADQAKKMQQFERDLARYTSGEAGITSGSRTSANALMNEYQAAMAATAAKYQLGPVPTWNGGKGWASGLEYQAAKGTYAQQSATFAAQRAAEEELINRHYQQSHAGLLAETEAKMQALGMRPEKSAYLTPYGGTFPATPLRPTPEALPIAPVAPTLQTFTPEEAAVRRSLLSRLGGALGGPLGLLFGFGGSLPGRGAQLLGAGARGAALVGSRAGGLFSGLGGALGTAVTSPFAAASEYRRLTAPSMFLTEQLENAAALGIGGVDMLRMTPGQRALGTIGAFFSGGAKGLGKAGGQAGRAVSGAFGGAGEGLGNLLGGIGSLFAGGAGKLGGLLSGGFTKFLDLIIGAPAKIAGFGKALLGLGASFLTVSVPVMLVVGAITLIVLAFTKFHDQTMGFINLVGGKLQPVFIAVKDTFLLFVAGIQTAWAKAEPEVSKGFGELLTALQKFMPVIKLAAVVVGGAFATILIAVGAVVRTFIQMLPTITAILTGVVNIVGDVVQLIVALLTGQWGKIPGIIGDIFGSTFSVIGNFFGLILGTVGGFVSNFIGFFQHLFDVLVGHSIIPDLVNAAIGWFLKLPGALLGAIASIPGSVANVFIDLAQLLGTAGEAAMHMLGSGIQKAAQFVLGPVLDVAKGIWDFLGFHSPPNKGPLSDSDQWMGRFMGMMGKGVSDNTDKVIKPITDLATKMGKPFTDAQTKIAKSMSDTFAVIEDAHASAGKDLPASMAAWVPPVPGQTTTKQTAPDKDILDFIKQYNDIVHASGQQKSIFEFTDTAYGGSAKKQYQEYLDSLAFAKALYLKKDVDGEAKHWKTILDFHANAEKTAYTQYIEYLDKQLAASGKAQRQDILNVEAEHQQIVQSHKRKQAEINASEDATNTSLLQKANSFYDQLIQSESVQGPLAVSKFLQPFQTLPDKMYGIATNAARAFGQGMRNNAVEADIAAGDLANQAIWRAQHNLQIKSPSKVFQQLGEYSAQGFAMGLTGNGSVTQALNLFNPARYSGGSGLNSALRVSAMYVDKLYVNGSDLGNTTGAGTSADTYSKTTAVQRQREQVWDRFQRPSRYFDQTYRQSYQYTS